MINLGSGRYERAGAAHHAAASGALLSLSTGQRQHVARLLGELGYDVGAMLVVVTDANGHPVSSWSRLGEIDVECVAMLSAASMLARLSLGKLLGFPASRVGVVQEHDSHTLFLIHIAADMAMVVVVEGPTRLGWVRVAAQRVGQMVVDLLATDAGAHRSRD